MILSKFIVVMEEKLKQIHDANKIFGRKDVLLFGGFLQMKDFGTTIFNSLHATVTSDYANCIMLMSEFDVFTLKRK